MTTKRKTLEQRAVEHVRRKHKRESNTNIIMFGLYDSVDIWLAGYRAAMRDAKKQEAKHD